MTGIQCSTGVKHHFLIAAFLANTGALQGPVVPSRGVRTSDAKWVQLLLN